MDERMICEKAIVLSVMLDCSRDELSNDMVVDDDFWSFLWFWFWLLLFCFWPEVLERLTGRSLLPLLLLVRVQYGSLLSPRDAFVFIGRSHPPDTRPVSSIMTTSSETGRGKMGPKGGTNEVRTQFDRGGMAPPMPCNNSS